MIEDKKREDKKQRRLRNEGHNANAVIDKNQTRKQNDEDQNANAVIDSAPAREPEKRLPELKLTAKQKARKKAQQEATAMN